MDELVLKELERAGVDVESVLKRFGGNKALLKRFLMKFPDDNNYEKLKTATQVRNAGDAFEAAHTLKGICENLSLSELTNAVSEQTEYLRSGDVMAAESQMPCVTDAYEKLIKVIREKL